MTDTFQAGKIARVQQEALSELVGRLQQGLPLEPWYANPVKAQMVDDLSGALNYWAAVPSLPVVIAAEYVDGEGRRVMSFSPDEIIAVPFTLGAGPWTNPQGYASSAEYGAPPGMRKAAISQAAGDMTGAVTGMGVTLDFDANILPPGRYYYNCHMLPAYPSTQSGFSVRFPR